MTDINEGVIQNESEIQVIPIDDDNDPVMNIDETETVKKLKSFAMVPKKTPKSKNTPVMTLIKHKPQKPSGDKIKKEIAGKKEEKKIPSLFVESADIKAENKQ